MGKRIRNKNATNGMANPFCNFNLITFTKSAPKNLPPEFHFQNILPKLQDKKQKTGRG